MSYSNNQDFDELLQIMGETFDAKDADYSGRDKPLGNFMLSQQMLGVSPEKGVAIRMCDKFSRVCHLIRAWRTSVKDETLKDTLLDLANYALIIIMLLGEKDK